MTTKGTAVTTIQAAPEAVWPWLAEVERHGQWSPKPFEAECVSGTTGQVGARYKSVGWVPNDKHHHNEVEITEALPGKRLALRSDDPMGAFINTYDLRAVDGGTEVTHNLEFPPLKGAAAMMVPILFPLVGKPDMRKRLGLLKAKVEAG